MPHDLYEATHIDGANAWRVFRDITLPLLAPFAATINLLPIIAVFLFLQRYFVEGIAGAVKS